MSHQARPRVLRLCIVGPPGSGKSSVGVELSVKYDLPCVDLDDVLTFGSSLNLPEAEEVRKAREAGTPLPEALVHSLFETRLLERDCFDDGFILVGYPMTASDVAHLSSCGIALTTVVRLEVPSAQLESVWTDRHPGFPFPADRLREYSTHVDPCGTSFGEYHIPVHCISAVGDLSELTSRIEQLLKESDAEEEEAESYDCGTPAPDAVDPENYDLPSCAKIRIIERKDKDNVGSNSSPEEGKLRKFYLSDRYEEYPPAAAAGDDDDDINMDTGRGRVIRAKDKLTGLDVAIKLVKLKTNHPRLLKNLYRELSILRHVTVTSESPDRQEEQEEEGEQSWSSFCPYVTPLIDLIPVCTQWEKMESVMVVLPWCETSLWDVILKPEAEETPFMIDGEIDYDIVKRVIRQMLIALKFLATAGILHRDIMTPNILWDQESEMIQMADFGLARDASVNVDDPSSEPRTVQLMTRGASVKGTSWYKAPELLFGDTNVRFGVSSSVWAVGCIMAELMSEMDPAHRTIFLPEGGDPRPSTREQLRAIFEILGSPKPDDLRDLFHREREGRKDLLRLDPKVFFESEATAHMQNYGGLFDELYQSAEPILINLLMKMFKINPQDRISIDDALNHRAFRDLRDELPAVFAPEPYRFRPDVLRRIYGNNDWCVTYRRAIFDLVNGWYSERYEGAPTFE